MSDAPTTPEVVPAPEVAPTEAAPRTFTQEEVNRIAAENKRQLREENERLAAELAAASEKAKKYDEYEAANKTELEKANEEAERLRSQLAEIEARAKAAEVSALRTRIGASKKLPDALIEVLQGEDEESITAHAEKLLASIPTPANPLPAAVHDVITPGKDEDPVRKAFLGLK